MERTASRPIELAFYGGTFTALPERLQMECLALAMQAKEKGIVCRVRCSTRPDALRPDRLQALRHAGLDLVELGIQSFHTEALLDGVAQDEATKQRYLQTIHRKEIDIETMVHRLFTFAKMDVSEYPVHIEFIPLHQAMRELTDEWDLEGLEIELEIPSELQVNADRQLLDRIVSNLLSNSQKYGGREIVHVRISAKVCGNMAEVTFADDGAGVPPEQLPKLFDVFFRGDAARTAPANGNGLGLAVVKKSVEAMGGVVHAEDDINGGLRIVFTLPLAKEEEDA